MERILEIVLRVRDEASKAIKSGLGGQLGLLEPQLKKIAAVSAIAFGALTAAVTLSVNSFSKAGDELAKMSLRTGFSVDALSRLKYAADLSGTSLAAIEIASKRMSVGLVDAANGSGNAANALHVLGLNAKEIIQLKPDEAFIKLTTAVAGVENPIQRAQIAVALFGRSGTDLLPLLEKGEEGLRGLMEEAEKVGYVFTNKTAKAAVDFNDNMTRLTTSIEAVKFSLGNAFLPVLDKMVTRLQPIIKGVSDWMEKHPTLTRGLVTAAIAVAGLTAAITTLVLILGPAVLAVTAFGVAVATALPIVGLITLAAGALGFAVGALGSSASDAADDISNLSQSTDSLENSLQTTQVQIGDTEVALGDLGKKAKEIAKEIKALEKEISNVMRQETRDAYNYRSDIAEAYVDQEKNIRDITQEIREKQLAARKSADRSQLDSEITNLQTRLEQETKALEASKWITTQYQTEVTEMRRRANQTEYENRLESIIRQRGIQLEAHFERLNQLKEELAEQQKMQAQITAIIEGENSKRATSYSNLASTVRSAFSSINSSVLPSSSSFKLTTQSSTPALPRAQGGPVSAGSPYLVGEQGPELFVPSRSGSIIPNGAGGGITVNVYGDVSGQDLIDKVSNALALNIKRQIRFV